ncbi:TPA: isoleucine--tRNA ligase [Candidatus Micrarchaeota archaeon]|nr:isoleucine--tRNA ligase [Candidatus Micrarchaeota archaeon]
MYDHKNIEKEISEFWEKKKIQEKVSAKNRGTKEHTGGEPFYFCDGPPYATGQIHPGTGWNKTIKDAVCRYWRTMGRDVRAQAGFDTHGLPIEVKVEQELGIKNKQDIEKYGIDKFIEKCKGFATKYIGVMSGQFRSLGVWLDFENPYITYKDDYINSSWKTLRIAWEKGLMHEGIYVLPYCYRCETTMANYELEYGEETDPSIYVKFKLAGNANEYLIIWTTTPWTLVGNMAVMVHPTLPYVKAKVDDEIWYVAKDRLEHVLEVADKSGTVLEETSGKKLEGKKYEHPFQDAIEKKCERRVVLSDEYITLEEGTGLVHCAPGHGPEDFIIGKRYDIEAFSPVDEHGCYTQEAGKYSGKNVRESNPAVIKELKEHGALIKESRIKHRYPHCWRCKTPLIFRTTKQWFITISKVKDRMMEEINNVEWHPAFVKERFSEFVSGAPDWCISRQRYWGIPLPIWRCESEKCGKIKVIGSRNELPKKLKDLHRPHIDEVVLKCECSSEMKRVPDVLDVWFDSGNAVWATLSEEDVERYSERTDIIIEGQDQIRGWFYSLLGSGIVRYNACPYKRLLMHGFFVDEKGEKMSKSLGNFVPLEEILEKYGADSFRIWGLSSTIWEELRFNWTEMKEASADLNILFNLYVFLGRFYPKKKIKDGNGKLSPDDAWLISRTNSVLKEYHEHMQDYELNKAIKAVRAFIVEDISRWYMKVAKERIAGGENAEGALDALYNATYAAVRMLAPFAPFVSEYFYQNFFTKYEDEDSISLSGMPKESDGGINVMLEKQMETAKEICSIALTIRQTANIKVRWPVRTVYIETKSHECTDAVKAMEGVIARVANVKEVKVVEAAPGDKKVASAPFSFGNIHITTEIDEELYEEAMGNEIKRRIQSLRKDLVLVEKDKIEVNISAEKELEGILEKLKDGLAKEVNAASIELEAGKETKCGKEEEKDKKVKEFEIDGRRVKIEIRKKEK